LKKIVFFICICSVVVIGCVLFFNKTFVHDYYQVTNDKGQEVRFTALQFSYYTGVTGETGKRTAVFYRFGNKQDMQDRLNHYVEGLTSCYDDGAFCDTKQDITVYSYQVSDGFLLHKISLVYDTIDLKDVENATGKDIHTLKLDGKDYVMQPGDSYVADVWGNTPEFRLNQINYDAAAITGRGITTGDGLDKVISAYNIKTDYGLWDVELNAQSDGSISIETRKYTTGEFDASGVIKATLVIAYYRLEGQWISLTYDEINQYIAYLNGEGPEKPYDGILMIQFQFPFNGYSKTVTDKTIANFSVEYAPGP